MSKQLSVLILFLLSSQLTFSQSGPPPAPPRISAEGRMPNNYRPVSGSEGLYIYILRGRIGLYSKTDRKFRTLNVYGSLAPIATKLKGRRLFTAILNRKYGVINENGLVVVPLKFDNLITLDNEKGFLGLIKGQLATAYTLAGKEVLDCEISSLLTPGNGSLFFAESSPRGEPFSVFDGNKCRWLFCQGNGLAKANKARTLISVLNIKGNEIRDSKVYNEKGDPIWSKDGLTVREFWSDDLWLVRGAGLKLGVIKPDNTIVIPIEKDNCVQFGDSFIRTWNKFLGDDVYTMSGEKIAENLSRLPYALENLSGFFTVFDENGMTGLANNKGEIVVPTKYSKIDARASCLYQGNKVIVAELYGKTEVYDTEFKLLTKHAYDGFTYTRYGSDGCLIIAGIEGRLEVLTQGYQPLSNRRFVSFFEDDNALKELNGRNLDGDFFASKSFGWLIAEDGSKHVIMKTREIISLEEFISSLPE